MNRQKIAQELVAVARDLTAKNGIGFDEIPIYKSLAEFSRKVIGLRGEILKAKDIHPRQKKLLTDDVDKIFKWVHSRKKDVSEIGVALQYLAKNIDAAKEAGV